MKRLLTAKNMFWCILSILIILNVSSIYKFPALFCDEVMGLNRAWSHITHQKKVLPEYKSIQTEEEVSFPRPIPKREYINLLLFFRMEVINLFGFSALVLRWISFVFGMLLLLVTYLLAKLWYNKKTGAIAVLFLAVSFNFWRASHLSRQEIVLVTYFMTAYYFFALGLYKNKNYLLVLSLLISILSYGIHQNGFLAPLILGALFIYARKKTFYKEKFFWIYSGIMGLAVIVFIFFIFPGFKPLLTSNNVHNPLLLYQDFNFLNEFVFLYDYFSHIDWIVITLWLGFFIHTCLFNRKQSDIFCLIILVIYLLGFIFVIANNEWYYLITYYPIVMISIASLVDRYICEDNFKLISKKVPITGIILLFLFYTFQYGRRVYLYKDYDYSKWTSAMKKVIPNNAIIFGPPFYWPAFYEHSFYMSNPLNSNQITFNQYIEKIKPDFIICNDNFDCYIQGILPTSRKEQIKMEYEDFIRTKTELILTVPPIRGALVTKIYKVKHRMADK